MEPRLGADLAWGSLQLRAGDRILCWSSEYAGNAVAMLQAVKQTGAVLTVLPMRPDGLVDVEALYSPSEPQDEEPALLPPEELLETEPPALAEGQVYFSSGRDEDGDTQCGFVWLAERVAVAHDVFCRPRLLFSDDPYWDWRAGAVGERGGIARSSNSLSTSTDGLTRRTSLPV